jgi:hypothetical protein
MLPAFPANGYAVEEAGMDYVAPPSVMLTGAGTESHEADVPDVEEGGDAVKVRPSRMMYVEEYHGSGFEYSFTLNYLNLQITTMIFSNHINSRLPFAFTSLITQYNQYLFLHIISQTGHHPCPPSIRT